ncbi:acyl-CoA dehydrogenase family protein [Nocardioides ferulae]|uniref:acyl-CoA dehydrogenase family protein n=1 Tax=Nocardioides ferulae TaxID=2340821 RepID=UPI000EB53D87|nr:acyl-CoA dehydrogenase family protein [Nocardioides ferulae]
MDGFAPELGVDLRAYAVGVRSFLTSTAALEEWRSVHYETTADRIRHEAGLMGVLHDAGWSRWGWPESVGGLGGGLVHRATLYDELAAAGLPIPQPTLMLETLGPALVRFAPHLAARHLPAYLRGEEWWGQGFSEPDAGSDLAGLRTRATRDGEEWVVSGQKLWTSHGETAHRFVCLVRTGAPESRHKGLSMVLVDRDAPGVTVRPIAIAGGRSELAEVFYDDVRIPGDQIVGAVDGGWSVAMYLLQFERSVYGWQCAAVALSRVRELVIAAADLAAGSGIPDGLTRRLGEVYTDVMTLRAKSAQTVRRLAAGEPVGPEASVDKVLLAAVEIGLYDLARELLGAGFLAGTDVVDTAWRDEWWYSRSATILGGSSEIQRTILADHVLRLPKEGVA